MGAEGSKDPFGGILGEINKDGSCIVRRGRTIKYRLSESWENLNTGSSAESSSASQHLVQSFASEEQESSKHMVMSRRVIRIQYGAGGSGRSL